MKLSPRQKIFNLVFASVLFVVTIWTLYSEGILYRPWKRYQKEFRQMELEAVQERLQQLTADKQTVKEEEKLQKITKELNLLQVKLANVKKRGVKIEQNWLLEFHNEADRCTTCHQSVEKPGFEDKPHPYRTHPGDYFRRHPVQKYGCINCHAGQGHALTIEAAHGETENWMRPLLAGGFAQSSCGKCHFADQRLPLDTELAGGEIFMKGWRLYMENNCLGCHKLSGYERPDRIGPVLTPVGKKVNRDWITGWIKNPKDYLPKTTMPNFLLEDEEINFIASYLLGLSQGEKIEKPASRELLDDEVAIESGQTLIRELGCLTCHTIEQIDEQGGEFGPNLSDIGGKITPDWLFYWLKNPKVYQPDTPMPNLRIPESEIQDIVAYLATLQQEKEPTDASQTVSAIEEDMQKGRELVKEKGCTGCHEIENFPLGFNAPEHNGLGSKRRDELAWGDVEIEDKNVIKYLQMKVMDPRQFATDEIIMKMPEFGFNEEQRDQLVTFLLSLSTDKIPAKFVKRLADPDEIEMRGRKFLEQKNCLGCHKIRDTGGDIAPDLTEESKKVRPEWLFDFLKSPHRIRPLQDARMPDFRLSDEEFNTAVEYLSFISNAEYPYKYEIKKEVFVGILHIDPKVVNTFERQNF